MREMRSRAARPTRRTHRPLRSASSRRPSGDPASGAHRVPCRSDLSHQPGSGQRSGSPTTHLAPATRNTKASRHRGAPIRNQRRRSEPCGSDYEMAVSVGVALSHLRDSELREHAACIVHGSSQSSSYLPRPELTVIQLRVPGDSRHQDHDRMKSRLLLGSTAPRSCLRLQRVEFLLRQRATGGQGIRGSAPRCSSRRTRLPTRRCARNGSQRGRHC